MNAVVQFEETACVDFPFVDDSLLSDVCVPQTGLSRVHWNYYIDKMLPHYSAEDP
jgi:hypothetical protein